MKQKQILLIIGTILILTFTLSLVSANHLACLTKGQSVPSNTVKRYTCEFDTCTTCVNDHNYPVYDKNCPGTCAEGTNNTNIDSKPPVLTVNSPVNDQIYNSRAVRFDLTSDETVSFYYTDNIKGRGVWKKIASNTKIFSNTISLSDGINDITIKAVDVNGNDAPVIRRFRLDTLAPKITKTSPTKGFANGKFDVSFTEANAKSLVLTYGNQLLGRQTANVDLSTCTGDPATGKYSCSINVPITDYNNQKMDYSFRLTDIANSYADSKLIQLDVDSSAPVINNELNMFIQNGKYITFNLSITEKNLLSASYYDIDASRPKWTKLCSTLKNGICTKKVTFTLGSGTHNVDIKVDDKAGNSVTKRISFTV